MVKRVFFYGTHKNLAWPGLISVLKDDMKPIRLQNTNNYKYCIMTDN